MPRVIHFEIPSHEPEKAIQFYGSVFDWSFSKWEGPQEYWLITTGSAEEPGINGGLLRRDTGVASTTVNTIGVPSVDDFAARVVEGKGEVVVPKMAIPGVGWFCYCKDPDGNLFGLMEDDRSAQ